jgi:XTP/dITP diphosphohydrolase
MTIWLASGNKHKQQELSAILADCTIKLPLDAGIRDFDPAETGTSFAENAFIKDWALYDMLNSRPGGSENQRPEEHEPVLADDSGLCVDALGGRPGIYSARYYGKDSWNNEEIAQHSWAAQQSWTARQSGAARQNWTFRPCETCDQLSAEKQNALLLEELAAVSPQGGAVSRRCRFVCAMVLFFGKDRFYLVQETLEGEIVPSAAEVRGRGGFGYDPIVYLPELGRTVAELSAEEKNRSSHRAKAGRAIARILADG